MNLLPYHQRILITRMSEPHYPDYRSALSGAANSRWYPLYQLLQARFRGGKSFTDYEVGCLIGLREEYENGVSRKG